MSGVRFPAASFFEKEKGKIESFIKFKTLLIARKKRKKAEREWHLKF